MIALALCSMLEAAAADYVIVVDEEVEEQSFTKKDLRKVLSRQSCCWGGGIEVALIFPPDEEDAMSWLLEGFVGLEPEVYRRYLMERCYRMGCVPMVGAPDLETAHEVASRTPGALTIAEAGDIPEGMKVMPIID